MKEKKRRQEIIRVGKDVEKKEHLYTVGSATTKIVLKLKIELS